MTADIIRIPDFWKRKQEIERRRAFETSRRRDWWPRGGGAK